MPFDLGRLPSIVHIIWNNAFIGLVIINNLTKSLRDIKKIIKIGLSNEVTIVLYATIYLTDYGIHKEVSYP